MKSPAGLTLIELLITLLIMGIIGLAAMPLLSSYLEAHTQGIARSRLYQEGLMAMERMTHGARGCVAFLIPNAHTPARDILAFSGTVNEDGDAYFGDALFPRIDEDSKGDSHDDSEAGIANIDDDGDGNIDEGPVEDDDEDGLSDEDILDGTDQDGDGNIDEDLNKDANDDGASGIAGMDDDGDGTVDNGTNTWDDDEDGAADEDVLNPFVYTFDNPTNTLTETLPFTGDSTALSARVTQFQATYELPDATHGPRVQIALTLTGDDGEVVSFAEYVYPRNVLQKTGKRVR